MIVDSKTVRTIDRKLRKELDRNEEPSAGIIDSQTVKETPESTKESGFDDGKLIKGRKRHIVVDTIGYPMVVVVHTANIYDGYAAKKVLNALFFMVNTVRKIWADGGYKGEEFIDWCKEKFNCVIEVVKKKKKKGFHVLPRRSVVEKTFVWLNRYRRLSKDYERKPTSSQSHFYVASIRLMLWRIFKERAKKLAENAKKLAESMTLLPVTAPTEA